jgi:hypothetical protein
MPLLRHLDLELSDYPATGSDVLATFCDMPLLRSVILDASAVRLMLPWAQLTSLTLLRVYPRQCVPVLQKTTNLVHCKLEVSFDSDTDQPGPDITLPYLESLSIDRCGATPVTDLLGTFIVPALRRLKVPEDSIEPNPIESLTGFISTSGCKLEKLHITGVRLLPNQSYRNTFPSIRKFSFDDEEESSDSDASDVDSDSDSE